MAENADEKTLNEGGKKEEEILANLLKAGIKAKAHLYFELMKKINRNERLTASELKLFQKLDEEIEVAKETLSDSGDEALKYNAAAEYLGISKRTLSIAVKKGRIRQEPNGDFLKAELDRYKRKQGYADESDDYAALKEEAELQLKQFRARREEYLLKQLTGEVISIDEVHREWIGRVKEITTGLMAWSNSLPPILEGKTKHEIKAIINREVRELLMRFARTGKWTPSPSQEQPSGGHRMNA